MIKAGDFPPLRAAMSWDGKRTTWRCDVCGCSVEPTHVPGSEDCWAGAEEKRISQSADDD